MDVFKERLSEVGFKVLSWGIVIAIVALCVWLATFIPTGAMHTISMVTAVVVGILFALAIIALVCQFIYWLFIEPFRKED